MGALEKLERRNQDYLLLETIKRVGVQNYSLLSRLTGINPETIRYKVNKHLTRLGLNTTVNINYGELGLTLSFLIVKPGANSGRGWLDGTSYLIYTSKLLGTSKYFCLAAVPVRFRKKYLDILQDMKERGELEDFEMTDLYWVRYPPFRADLYDFERKTWHMDWNRFSLFSKESGPSYISVNRDSVVDYVDLKILKSMLEDPTLPLAKTAKGMNANPRTVRYHNSEHISNGKFILSNNIRWVKPLQEGSPGKMMQVALLFRNLGEQDIEKVRKFCNNLPFTWFEAGTAERTYLSLADVPLETFQETLQRIESYLGGIGQHYELMLLDSGSSRSLGIPDEMFDAERGWRLFNVPIRASEDPGGEKA